ncbi:MAG: hypothetical protein R3C32_08400 [Chloroflexota bacterium]
MTDDRDIPPADLRALARERSRARREHRFADADRMRAEIEAQGWNVVDRGAEARLVRAHPLDVIDPDAVTRYGWSGAVPEVVIDGSPSADAGVGTVAIVLRALPEAEATGSLVARLTAGGAAPRRILVVAGDDTPDPVVGSPEVVRLRGGVGPGTLLAVALRRVAEGTVVVGERWPADATPTDIDTLVARLHDPEVAVTGLVGQRSRDLRRFAPGGEAGASVEAVGWAGLAFRARDGRARGPVDEGFGDPELLAAWWSLRLRDDPDAGRPRRAVAHRATAAEGDPVSSRDDRATRRDRYRLIDAFAGRDDLLAMDGGPAT